MRYLIFSDSHLSDRFEQKKFNFLRRIIKSSDKVIINGDFWEGYDLKIEDFVNTKWSGLFKLLKEKNAVYLYGNHDKKEYSNSNVALFSKIQKTKFTLQSGKYTFYIEHGDRITPLWDKYFKRMPKLLNKSLYYLEKFVVLFFGIEALGLLYKKFNKDMINKVSRKLKNNQYLICGHSHFMEYDEKNHFINTGFVKHGFGQYVTIDNGKIELHNESY